MMSSVPLNANFSEELGSVVITTVISVPVSDLFPLGCKTTYRAYSAEHDNDDDDTYLPPLIDVTNDDNLPQFSVYVDERSDNRRESLLSMVPDELRDDDWKKCNASRCQNFDGFGQVHSTTPHMSGRSTATSWLPTSLTAAGHTQEVWERMFM